MRKQVELLEGHAGQCALAGDLPLRLAPPGASCRLVADLLAVDGDRATLKLLQHVDAAKHRRLARAAGAYDADHLPLAHRAIDPLQHLDCAVAFVKIADFEKIGHRIANLTMERRSCARRNGRSARCRN